MPAARSRSAPVRGRAHTLFLWSICVHKINVCVALMKEHKEAEKEKTKVNQQIHIDTAIC